MAVVGAAARSVVWRLFVASAVGVTFAGCSLFLGLEESRPTQVGGNGGTSPASGGGRAPDGGRASDSGGGGSGGEGGGGSGGESEGGSGGTEPDPGGAGGADASVPVGGENAGGAGGNGGGSGGEGGSSSAGEGGGSSGGDGGDGGDTSGGEGGGGGAPADLDCTESELVGTGAPLIATSTVDGGDDFSGSCGVGSAPDLAFEWIAPATDYFSITTTGSSFDTTLYLLTGDCNGTEIACNDNAGGSGQSEILHRFDEGERVVIVVDGKTGDQGDVQLNVDRVTCPSVDLTEQPLPVHLSTASGTSVHDGTCGGAGNPERAFRWVPSEAGMYSITAASTDFKPAIYLEQGARCGGTRLGCNAGSGANPSYPAEVLRYLEADEPVTIFVDGTNGSGFFDLDVQRVDALVCPMSSSLPSGPVALGGQDTSHSTGSCVDAGSVQFGISPEPHADHAYQFDVDFEPTETCWYTITATGPIAVYRMADYCVGPELSCELGTFDGNSSYVVEFSLSLNDNGPQTLVVESLDQFAITYEITWVCAIA